MAAAGASHALKKEHVAALFAGVVGIILSWRGVWELSAAALSAEQSLVLGMAVLAIVALVERRFLFKLLAAYSCWGSRQNGQFFLAAMRWGA